MSQPRRPATRSFSRGFKMTSALLGPQIRAAGEKRGFAVTRLLTHWPEIVGEDVAGMCRPVNVSYGRGNFGATLILLTTGARAPMLEMQKEKIREKVNACYGYAAIKRVKITQTAPTGFAEGQVSFDHRPRAKTTPPDPAIDAHAEAAVAPITDQTLRSALESLGRNVLRKSSEKKGLK
ncbi:DUF721 domain-containing protein [Oceaniglobus ichthyenteri]|uniref:DUF721 domain-containing protein n=1 Tax=Oceaniglobus ichthyenteri TaxID=2136177 RepID=UPI000D362F90|nr:DUF721 domain-containing protein [Oceaniglobus ichthyenteri]